MEKTAGLTGLLRVSRPYGLLQRLVGAGHATDWLVAEVCRVREGQTVVDAGCGPGTLLDHLPKAITYFGFDISEPYIRTVQSAYPARGGAEFTCCDAAHFIAEKRELEGAVDIVLTNGVLHHLDDEAALGPLQVASRLLRPRGRFISLEPTFLRRPQWFSRWIISRDRGQNVRQEDQWRRLIGSVFADYDTSIITGLLRIPYPHIVIEAQR